MSMSVELVAICVRTNVLKHADHQTTKIGSIVNIAQTLRSIFCTRMILKWKFNL